MEITAKTRKKGRAGRAILWILFAIVMLVLLLAGFLLVCIRTAPQQYDDMDALRSEPPLALGERYAFSAASASVEVTINKADLVWLAEQPNVGLSKGNIDAALAPYGVSLSALGISLNDEGCAVTALLGALGGRLKIPAEAQLDISGDSDGVDISLDRVRLSWLPWMDASALLERLKLDGGMLKFRIAPKTVYPRLEEMTDFRTETGRIAFTLPIEKDDTRLILEGGMPARTWGLYTELPLAGRIALEDYHHYGADDYENECFIEALKELERDPAYIIDYREGLLACCVKETADSYFDAGLAAYRERFLPGLTMAAVDARRSALEADAAERRPLIDGLAKALFEANKHRELLFDTTRFVERDGETEFTAVSLAGDRAAGYAGWFDFDSARIILTSGVNEYTERNAYTYGSMPKTRSAQKGGLTARWIYVPVLIARMCDGTPVVFYVDGADSVYINFISEHSYGFYMKSERVPTCIPSGAMMSN